MVADVCLYLYVNVFLDAYTQPSTSLWRTFTGLRCALCSLPRVPQSACSRSYGCSVTWMAHQGAQTCSRYVMRTCMHACIVHSTRCMVCAAVLLNTYEVHLAVCANQSFDTSGYMQLVLSVVRALRTFVHSHSCKYISHHYTFLVVVVASAMHHLAKCCAECRAVKQQSVHPNLTGGPGYRIR